MKFTVYNSGEDHLIFLHGWGANSSSFDWLKNYITNKTLHIADLDGFGGEPAPDDPSVQGYAKRLAEYITTNELTNVILVGHSFGGRVAIEYAGHNNIKGLVLVDSAGLKPKFSFKKAYKISKYKFVKKLAAWGLVNKSKLKKYGSPDYAACDEKLKRVLVCAVNYNQSKLIKNIKCQTLIVWGEKDKDTPIYMAKRFNKGIKSSGLVVLPGAGHFSFLNNPGGFAKIIDYFVDNI